MKKLLCKCKRRTPRIVVTAGPTREFIDPVRYISNCSTGTFGYEIAEDAGSRGWKVTLISGPVSIEPPKGVRLICIETALEMQRAVKRAIKDADCLIMAAAVSDWRAFKYSKSKIKRHGDTTTLRLKANPDILHEVGKCKTRGFLTVGFALESDSLDKHAAIKLKMKRLDFIVANKLGDQNGPFGGNRTTVTIIDKFGNRASFNKRTKKQLANIILDKVSEYII